MMRVLFFIAALFYLTSGQIQAVGTQPDSLQKVCRETGEIEISGILSEKFPLLFSFLEKHKLKSDTTDNFSLYDMVRRWYRTPYRWAGTSKKGVDCQGFVLVLNDTLYNRTLPRGAGAQYAITDPIKNKEDLKEGDLVFFKIGTYAISHVGLYLKDGKFVHASSGYGVIISDLNEPYYKRWYFSGGRINEEKLSSFHKPVTKSKQINTVTVSVKPESGSILR